VSPTKPTRPVRKQLDHTAHFHGRFGAMYFVTICCQSRRQNQLCRRQVGEVIFETARTYDKAQRWYLYLLLLMPDHLHMLVSVSGDTVLSNLMRDFKRVIARTTGIKWQRNFFDHRIRNDENLESKAAYICANPVRAKLIREGEKWPFVLDRSDLEK
jgi:putative transposase